jgi:hypothetical protein
VCHAQVTNNGFAIRRHIDSHAGTDVLIACAKCKAVDFVNFPKEPKLTAKRREVSAGEIFKERGWDISGGAFGSLCANCAGAQKSTDYNAGRLF